MPATLTLRCNTYQLNPPTQPITACYDAQGWSVSSTDGSTIKNLTLLASQDPGPDRHIKLQRRWPQCQPQHRRERGWHRSSVFQKSVTNSRIITGTPVSTGGDEVRFQNAVTLATVTTDIRNDTIVFASSTTNGTTINASGGSDSIQFTSTARVGAGTLTMSATMPSPTWSAWRPSPPSQAPAS
jgi:hypothetical protein